MESTRCDLAFTAPLTAITGVTDVILSLALFACHVLLHKELARSFDWISAFIGLAAFTDVFHYKVPAIPAVGVCACETAGPVLTLSKYI